MTTRLVVIPNAPFLALQVSWDERGLTQIDFVDTFTAEQQDEANFLKGTQPTEPLVRQLLAYLSGITLEVPPIGQVTGTPFQQEVWQAIAAIPYGQTRSYKEVAEAIGRPRAFRAVANACGANYLPIVIPCHRVVGTGHVGGYSSGLDKKKWLFQLEGIPWPS